MKAKELKRKHNYLEELLLRLSLHINPTMRSLIVLQQSIKPWD